MQTCSNCGAAVRTGAKFCTKCGTRLNPAATTQEGQEQWTVAPTSDAESPTDTAEVESPSEDADTSTPSWEWAPASDTPEKADAETAATSPEDRTPDWAASWASASEEDADPSEHEEPSASLRFAEREADPLMGMTVEPPPAETELFPDEDDDEELVTLEDAEQGRSASTWSENASAAADQDTGALPTPETLDTGAPEPDVQTRAEALVRELDELLPMLAASPAGGNTAVADALEGALGDTSRYDTLRDTLRSIDTTHRSFDDVLKLVDQAETLNALQEDYDRLAAATRAAIATLRGEGASTNEE